MELEFVAKEGFAAAGDRVGVVVLETVLDEALRDLGFARELQNRVQTLRKELGLEYTDRIVVSILGSDRVLRVLRAHGEAMAKEVLAQGAIGTVVEDGASVREVDVDGERVTVGVTAVHGPHEP